MLPLSQRINPKLFWRMLESRDWIQAPQLTSATTTSLNYLYNILVIRDFPGNNFGFVLVYVSTQKLTFGFFCLINYALKKALYILGKAESLVILANTTHSRNNIVHYMKTISTQPLTFKMTFFHFIPLFVYSVLFLQAPHQKKNVQLIFYPFW